MNPIFSGVWDFTRATEGLGANAEVEANPIAKTTREARMQNVFMVNKSDGYNGRLLLH